MPYFIVFALTIADRQRTAVLNDKHLRYTFTVQSLSVQTEDHFFLDMDRSRLLFIFCQIIIPRRQGIPIQRRSRKFRKRDIVMLMYYGKHVISIRALNELHIGRECNFIAHRNERLLSLQIKGAAVDRDLSRLPTNASGDFAAVHRKTCVAVANINRIGRIFLFIIQSTVPYDSTAVHCKFTCLHMNAAATILRIISRDRTALQH